MSKNVSIQTVGNALPNVINDLKRVAQENRTNQVSPLGYFPIQQGTGGVESASPVADGSIYYNTSTHIVRAKIFGTWRDLATSSSSVSSVALALPASVFSVSGSPVTSSGTLTGAFVTQSANTVFAGPTTGSAATPTFRSLVIADLPTSIPNANLANSTIGLSLGTSGSDLGVSGSPASLGTSLTLNVPTASASNRGALSAADWSTFNGKQSALTFGNLTVGSNLSVSGGTSAVIGSGTSISLGTNVVTAVTNDTNVTGSIASNTLTLGWTGQLAVGRGGTGVSSLSDILGTSNQVIVSGGTARVVGGNVTLSLPQSIGTSSSPTFASITISNAPTVSTDATNKAYVDGVAQGLSIKQSVRLATVAALPSNTYLLGVLTEVGNGALTVDSVVVANGDRILVKDESTQANNGIYTVTDKGSGSTPYILTRSSDMDAGSEVPGAFVFVEDGTVNESAGFVVAGSGPYTIGTTAIVWTQFSGAGEIIAGAGLTKTGNTLDVVGTANRIQVNADSVDISASYVGQSSITTLGTIATGIWQGTSIATTYTDAKIKTVTGTSSRITIGGTATDPTFDISASYVGQSSITTLGTIATGVWHGSVIAEIYGGTNQSGYTLGDLLYASATDTLSKLAGNTTTTKKYLSQTGNATISAAPVWAQIASGDINNSTFVTSVSGTTDRVSSTGGLTPVIDIASTYVGQTSITTLGTISTGTWSATTIAVNKGGTGQTSYTDGQLLIGNTTGNTLAKATLSAGTAIGITNGHGTITIDNIGVTSLAGTADRITVSASTGGVTLDIAATYVGQSSITTLGTISTGTWSATTIAVNKGGTGQTSYTDGQLLIGNTTGNTLTKATITGGTAISITNGNGSITIDNAGVTAIAGTSNRITLSASTGSVTVDISASYVGQASITTLGTIATGTWNGSVIAEAYGGTNQSTYALGDILYSSATNTLSKLGGNTTTTRKFLRQTGNGSVSAAPAWDTIVAADIPGSALTKTDDTNVTLTLGGAPTTALLNATSLTLGWTGQLSIARGGTGASTATAAFDALSPMTTLGDIIYGGASGTRTRLAGNTTTTKKFLTQTGDSVNSAAPGWNTIVAGDLPGSFSGFANPTASIGLSVVNGSATTAMRSDGAPAIDQSIAPTWTGTHTFNKAGIAATSTDAAVLTNSTAATVGVQQYSPRLRFTGNGWKTNATAASQVVDWIIENRPVQGAANPTSVLAVASQINAGGYLDLLTINSAGTATFLPAVSTTTTTTGQYAGISVINANVSQYATIDGNGNSLVPINFLTKSNNFGGIYGQNLSNGGNASTDVVLINDAGTAFTNYIDMGINSSLNNNASYTVQGAGAGYLYVNGGDMVMGTQSAKNIIFHTNGTLAANERMRITSAGNVGIGMTPVNKLDVTGNVGITQSSSNASLTLSTSGATASATFALASNGTVGGTGGATQITFSEGSNLTGQLICAVNNAVGNRYFGFIARTDRDGNNLPMRFFTFDAGGTARDTIFLGTNEAAGEQGKIGYGTSAPTAKHHFIQNTVASVSSGNGTAATTFLTMGGGIGGSTTDTGTVTGGKGASGALTLGAGGVANSATVLGTGGAGGDFTLTTGGGGNQTAGSAANNTGGASGALSITGGVGGNATGNTTGNNTGGAGGLTFIAGGRGGAASNANGTPGTIQGGVGGDMEVRGGLGGAGTGGTAGNGGAIIFKTSTTTSLTERARILNDGTIGIGTATPQSLLDISSTTGAVVTLSRNDTSVTANDSLGIIQWYSNDTSTTTNNLPANIEVQATNTIATDINPTRMIFRTTGTGVAAAIAEAFRIENDQTTQFSATIKPFTNDGAALGTGSLMWSDLFLASGGVINFNNGDITLTHSANLLTFAGASSGYTFDSSIKSSSASAGIGYGTGAGGTQPQSTNKSTTVTLNAICGQITMNNAALGATTSVQFTLSNTSIAATDLVIVNFASANTANSYTVVVDAVATNSCKISVRNYTAGSLSEAIVLNFAVIKAVTS